MLIVLASFFQSRFASRAKPSSLFSLKCFRKQPFHFPQFLISSEDFLLFLEGKLPSECLFDFPPLMVAMRSLPLMGSDSTSKQIPLSSKSVGTEASWGAAAQGMSVIAVACGRVVRVTFSIVSGATVVWGGVAGTGTSTEVAWLAVVCAAGTTVTGHKVDGEADVRQE